MFGNRGPRPVLTGKIILMSTTFAELENSPAAEGPSDQDRKAVAQLKSSTGGIKAELAKVIVGQEAVVDQVLIAILTRSHALLVGVPGLAKTLLVSTLSQTLHLSFKRIQFTPDLMPSDITGTEVIYQEAGSGKREFRFLKGPIFANMILVDYPTAEEELQIMKTATGIGGGKPAVVLTEQEILTLQHVVRRMPVAEHVYSYAEKLVRVTRPASSEALDFCKKWLTWGAGPRAGLNLILAAKARAMLHGQFYVSCDDVASVAPPIFRHRIIPNFSAQSEGVTSDDITRKILEAVPKDEKLK